MHFWNSQRTNKTLVDKEQMGLNILYLLIHRMVLTRNSIVFIWFDFPCVLLCFKINEEQGEIIDMEYIFNFWLRIHIYVLTWNTHLETWYQFVSTKFKTLSKINKSNKSQYKIQQKIIMQMFWMEQKVIADLFLFEKV